jgi:hypothetical protein
LSVHVPVVGDEAARTWIVLDDRVNCYKTYDHNRRPIKPRVGPFGVEIERET